MRRGITLAAGISAAALAFAAAPAAYAGGGDGGGGGCHIKKHAKHHGCGGGGRELPTPMNDCQQNRHGTYLDLGPVGYICLLPAKSTAAAVAVSDLVCGANNGHNIDASSLLFACLGTSSRDGADNGNHRYAHGGGGGDGGDNGGSPDITKASNDCTNSRQGTFINASPLAYVCLAPKDNTLVKVAKSVLICGTPVALGGEGGTWMDADGLAFICLAPGGAPKFPSFPMMQHH
jgi:hypothetical protein